MVTFYFEAQTGLIRDNPPSQSNFYQYKLPESKLDFVKDAVAAAEEGVGGLQYSETFLKWLSDNDIYH